MIFDTVLNIMVFKVLLSDCSLLVYRKIIDFYGDFVTYSCLNIEVPILGVVAARSSLSSSVPAGPGVSFLQSPAASLSRPS